jgi:UDP-N-acetylglucosamine diphosphorylase/glucosamine-1-phosphate N-acetyltransferase
MGLFIFFKKMKNIILFDSEVRQHLLPLTFTRPVADLRVGILTIREKWEQCLEGTASYITEGYLSTKFPINISDDNYIIDGSILPNDDLTSRIADLGYNEALVKNGELIAARVGEEQFERVILEGEMSSMNETEVTFDFTQISRPWHIFEYNDKALRADFQRLTKDRKSQPISATNQVLGKEHIFLEEGAKVECSILNATTGPIYIGKNAEIMEGCIVRGALALCEGAILKMGAKLYGANTFGPHCKVGGEVGNSVLLGYSNKGHDGYLGNSVLGEWCNLGADTNTSNLKNTYDEVRLWSYVSKRFVPTGQNFLGLIMGDHSKAGINSMFNTGTVVGVACNIFGEGYPRNIIPSFAWGGYSGFITHKFEKAIATAKIVTSRRNIVFTDGDEQILKHLYETSSSERSWDKK